MCPFRALRGQKSLLFASVPAPQLSFQRIEDLAAAEGQRRVPHRHPYHAEVMYVEAGEAECFVEGRAYRLRAGDLYGLPNGVVHACGHSPSLRGWVLHCLPAHLAERPADVLADVRRGNLTANSPARAGVERLWASFLTEYATARPGRPQALRAYLRLLGVYLRRLSPKPDLNAGSRTVSAAFLDLLDTQYAHERNPALYAAQLGITAEQLNHRLREETGSPTREHIDRRVMLEARRLLAFTGIHVQDIARRLGFEDPQYFYRYFRKHAGTTPGQWREAQLQEFQNAGAPGLELPF